MALQFTQEEISRAIRDIVKHGDIREIAIISGIGEKYLYGQFNPDDDRKSYIYGYLQIQAALDRVNAERGEELFLAVRRFRDLSQLRKNLDLSARTETEKFLKEQDEFLMSRINGLNYAEQIKELDDVISQAKHLKMALTQKHLKQKQEANGSM